MNKYFHSSLESVPRTGRSLLVHVRRFLRQWWKGLTKKPIDLEAQYVRSGPGGCADPHWLNDRKMRPYLKDAGLGYFNHEAGACSQAFEFAVSLINDQAQIDGEVMEGAIHDAVDSTAANFGMTDHARGELLLELLFHFEAALAA